jgi:uncharacterized tellurite resistance protein B-like protein
VRSLLGKFLGHTPKEQAQISPQLAVAELLLEMTRADYAADASETKAVRDLLHRAYGLQEDELEALLKEAGERLTRSVTLHATVDAINAVTGQEERKALLGMLWRVAYADGKLDKYEEALLRKLSDLLFVAHSDFIREKLAVLNEKGG